VSHKNINKELESKLATHLETIKQLSGVIFSIEREIADTQAQLVAAVHELNGALESLKVPIRINNYEDVKQMV